MCVYVCVERGEGVWISSVYLMDSELNEQKRHSKLISGHAAKRRHLILKLKNNNSNNYNIY